ncbi:signal peptidase I [Lacinutrix salivirga]
MSYSQLIIFILVLQVIHGLGTWKLYIKAGRQAWEAFVPFYNAFVLMKIINRPWYWVILLFLPIVNLIMFPVVWVETARSFGKNTYLDSFLAIVTLGFYNYYLNYVADVSYVENRDLHPKSSNGDWISSILFAIVAATIVHTYFIQPYVIPSSSLEKSLLVGDFLFVSKMHYGARIPQTTVALPMVHDSIPKTSKKSYLFNDDYTKRNTSWINKLQLPYMRIPGFESIERNDIVVFNQPADTLLNMNDFKPDRNYYKPIDKKTNLVKRCVAIGGDTLSIKEGYVYINGKKNVLPDRAHLQFFYDVKAKVDVRTLFKQYGITETRANRVFSIQNKFWDNSEVQNYLISNDIILDVVSKDSLNTRVTGGMTQAVFDNLKVEIVDTKYLANMTSELAEKLRQNSNVISVTPSLMKEGLRDPNIFPHDPNYKWNNDFFGPLYIPEKGATISINTENLPLYKRAITEYEGNTVNTNGNQIIINGEVADSYTFKQDYYWMMGDNRQNSLDARAWGLVPFDHVVGKPVFIWMSFDGSPAKPRWERFFTTVGGSGERVSYLIPFLVLLLGYFGYKKWRKSKKAA